MSAAVEIASMEARRGKDIWAIIWQVLKVFSVFSMRDMIKGFMDQLYLGNDGPIELNEKSRIRQLQISSAVSILIFLGVLAKRLMHMVTSILN